MNLCDKESVIVACNVIELDLELEWVLDIEIVARVFRSRENSNEYAQCLHATRAIFHNRTFRREMITCYALC